MNFALISVIVLLASFFIDFSTEVIPIVTYFDEAVCLFALFQIIRKRNTLLLYENRFLRKMFNVICIITIIGVICNYIFNIQNNLVPILNDIGNCFKVFITYIGITMCVQTVSNRTIIKSISLCSKVLYIFVVILMICALLNYIGDFGMRLSDVRYGLPVFGFLYSGGGILSNYCYSIIIILSASLLLKQTKPSLKKGQIMIFIALLVWLTTLRSRAFLCVILYILLYYQLIIRKKQIRINFVTIVFGGLLAYVVVADQIEFYTSSDGMARYNFIYYGIQTFKDFFPLGAGFGTYGTDVACKYYSPLYVKYGFENIWGLSPDDPSLAHDTYWPAIMGQFGLIGIILFVLLIFFLYKDIINRSKGNPMFKLIAIFICFSQTVASLATATFFSPVTLYLMFFTAIVLRANRITAIHNNFLQR